MVSLLKPSEITAEWLTERLRLNGFLEEGEVVDVQVAPHANAHYRETFFLSVTYSSGAQTLAPEQMVYKLNDKGEGLGVREVTFYRDLMSQMDDPPVPVCLDVGEVSGDGYLLLADMSGTHEQGHPDLMTPEMLKRSMEMLAMIHGFWWDHPKIQNDDFLGLMDDFSEVALMSDLEKVRSKCERLADVRWPEFIAREGDGFLMRWREICECVVVAWPRVFEMRMKGQKNLTLIHGDFTPGNQLIPFDAEEDRLLIYDWEVSTRGIGVYDLAYFFNMIVPEDDSGRQMERDMISWYHNGLLKAGVAGYSLEDCVEDCALSIVAGLFYPIEQENLSLLAKGLHRFEAWQCEDLLSGGSV